MSLHKNDILSAVKHALKSENFDSVAELSKSDFEKMISQAIYSVITSRDFERGIKEIVR